MTFIQIAILIVGAILILSSGWQPVYNFISTKLKRSPKEYTLGELVSEWERFKNILAKNNMEDCVKDMKDVLVKMTQEYGKR